MKMKNDKLNKIIIILLLLLFCGMIFFYMAYLKGSQMQINETGKSEYYGTETTGSRMILNNIWGATTKELKSKSIQSYIYARSDGSFGWEWDRPDPRPNVNTYITPIYPEVIVGSNSGNSYSTSNAFPIRYGDIHSWDSIIQFEYLKSPNGLYNLAYDIYWMDKKIKKFNVMIWIEGHYDGGKPIGEVSDGINTYIHYYKPAGQDSLEWHAFELKNQGDSNNKVNIKILLDNAFTKSEIDNNWIIPGIELGSEVWRGSGRIQINKYEIMINGNLI